MYLSVGGLRVIRRPKAAKRRRLGLQVARRRCIFFSGTKSAQSTRLFKLARSNNRGAPAPMLGWGGALGARPGPVEAPQATLSPVLLLD